MRCFYIFLCAALASLFTLFPQVSMKGAAKGLELFAHGVFPALFPFCCCIGCLKRLGAFSARKDTGFFGLLRLMLLGAAAGNPTGSMLLGGLNSGGAGGCCGAGGAWSSVYAALFNLASPAFIVGSVCSRMLRASSPRAAILLLGCHYLSAFVLFCIHYAFHQKRLRRAANDRRAPARREAGFGDCEKFGQFGRPDPIRVFPAALMETAETMLKLCGTIVFFVSLAELFSASPLLAPVCGTGRAVLTGMLEMTNGLSLLFLSEAGMRLKLSLACFLLSFGGICIFMQASAVSRVKAGAYLLAKLAHGALAFALCYLLFPLFFNESVSVFGSGGLLGSGSSLGSALPRALSMLEVSLLMLTASAAACAAAVFMAKRTRV